MLDFKVYWSFRSPYSYLATGRLREIARKYEVRVDVGIVLPLAIRDPSHFTRVHPLWGPYLLRDTMRVAEMYGIDYRWPNPDPVVSGMQRGEFPAEQPFIHRLSRLGVAAEEAGKGLDLICEVSALIWDGHTQNWHEGDHLAQAVARTGLDLGELEEKTSADAVRYDELIQQNQTELEKAGHWGVPTMVFKGEPFFGQDHIDALLWRMGKSGLTER